MLEGVSDRLVPVMVSCRGAKTGSTKARRKRRHCPDVEESSGNEGAMATQERRSEDGAVDDAAAFRGAVFDWMERYAEHEPDWTDACLAVLSGDERAAKVWTYDRQFRGIWRRPDGGAISLVTRIP
jgi:hypothetical protein